MVNRCPRCEFVIKAEDKFCGGCGFKLTGAENFVAMTQVEMKLSDIRLNLGMVYFKKGDYQKAMESFQKILEEDPANKDARDMLKQAEEAMKNLASAT